MSRFKLRKPGLLTCILLFVVLALGITLRVGPVQRVGLSTDEELSFFAVRAVSSSGLPLLPSGSIYERALPYTYSCWVVGSIFGQNLISYRWVSLFFGIGCILLIYLLSEGLVGEKAALISAVLMAFSLWPIVFSYWARMYSMFLFFFLAAVLFFFMSNSQNKWKVWFLFSVVVSRILYEPAVTLSFFPFFAALLSPKGSVARRENRKLFLQTLLLLVLAQSFLHFINYAAGNSYLMQVDEDSEFYVRTMKRLPDLLAVPSSMLPYICLTALAVITGWLFWRRRIDWVVPLILLGLFGQIGLLFFLSILMILVHQSGRWFILKSSLLIAAVSLFCWAAYTAFNVHTVFSLDLIRNTFMDRIFYPFNSVFDFVRNWPITSVFTAAILSLTLTGRLWDSTEVNVMFSVIVLSFSLFQLLPIGIQPRHIQFLFTLVFVLNAWWWVALKHFFSRMRPSVSRILCSSLVFLIVSLLLKEQHQGLRSPLLAGDLRVLPFRHLELRTLQGSENLKLSALKDKIILTNDELACRYFINRSDFWILWDKYSFWHWSFLRAGARYGVYAASKIIADSNELGHILSGPDRARIAVILLKTVRFGSRWNEITATLQSQGFKPVDGSNSQVAVWQPAGP